MTEGAFGWVMTGSTNMREENRAGQLIATNVLQIPVPRQRQLRLVVEW